MVEISTIRSFWEKNPVGAGAISEQRGTYDFFRRFDNLREASDCEPYPFSNEIHGYEQSAGKRVLDIGCGNGYVLYHYVTNGSEVCGIDITEEAIRLSKQRFKMCEIKGEFQLTNANEIPYPDAYFDIVCSMGVLHHIKDPRPMIQEIYRVVKSGGEVILMLYNKNSFRNHVTFRVRKYFGPAMYRGKSMQEIRNMNDGPDCPLALVYSKEEVKELLVDFSDVKFIVNKLSYKELLILPLIIPGLVGKILRKVAIGLLANPSESFFAKRWGWNLYVKAKKA